MRRALTMSRRSPDSQLYSSASTTSTAHRASGIDRSSTILGSGQRSSAVPSTPRRAVSASAELFRRKQGAKDWNARKRVSDDVFNTPGNEADFGDDEEDVHDWDLEGAAEGRRVQTTFTVPREKLRVVNATAGDIDSTSERSVSWGTGNRRVST
ncbi:Galactose oxidase/kelch beta-propeller [Penicillium fimorum]|uniref:Galactose oxidase/kelch beta-propeller n=1 Tax=Penicillium fimorum TaxID=1882269 RepID=A0A9W9Y2N0_9EURO|nr:Galactose oxidase/kelch beta-propeller [Penicillium fimorum]